jgi:hypothetical protein
MQELLRTRLAWILVALFLFSAGHGVVFHADNHHKHSPQDCALCVLAWTAALATAATAISASLLTAPFQAHRRDWVVQSSFAYSRSQRAPPASSSNR